MAIRLAQVTLEIPYDDIDKDTAHPAAWEWSVIIGRNPRPEQIRLVSFQAPKYDALALRNQPEEEPPVLGTCTHGVDLDHAFCDHGCRV